MLELQSQLEHRDASAILINKGQKDTKSEVKLGKNRAASLAQKQTAVRLVKGEPVGVTSS